MQPKTKKYYCVTYWYTTPLNEKFYRVKNGSARREANSAYEAAEIRIKEQLTAANSADTYRILHVEDISDLCETGNKNESLSKLRQLEKNWLHARQKRMGMWVPSKSKKSEWFQDISNTPSIENVVNIGKRLINERRHGVTSLASYESHRFQIEAVNKAVEYYRSGGTDFLLDATMRFGKCHTSYLVAKDLGCKRVLIITGRPKVKNGWANDLDHVKFGKWAFIDSQIETDVKFSDPEEDDMPEAEIIFASFQGAKRVNLSSRLERVLNQEIDLIVIDEFHAYYSPETKEFIDKLKTKFGRLWVSGTPFTAYEQGKFDGVSDTYRFTMIDALRAKKANLDRFKEFPEPLLLISEFPEELKNRFAGDEEMNMAKLLSNNQGIPNYPQEVNGILNTLINPTASAKHSAFLAGNREGVKTNGNRTHNHLWFAVPRGKDDSKAISVASADTLIASFKEHPAFVDYMPLKVGGETSEDESSVQSWHITHNKTAILSAGSLNTGTTLPKLDTLVYLKESESAAEFWQTFGRIMNPESGKEVVTAVLPGPEFYANMLAKMVEYSSNGSNFQQVFEEAVSLMPSYVVGGVKPIAVDLETAYKLLSFEGSVHKSFKDSTTLNYNIDQLIASNLTELAGLPDISSKKEPRVLNSQILSGKNTNRTIISGGPKTKSELSEIAKIKARIREFNTTIPSIVALARATDSVIINCVNDLKKIDSKLLDRELFPDAKQWVDYLFEKGFLNRAVIEKKIAMFNKFEVDPLCK
jgi:hypothetical protein